MNYYLVSYAHKTGFGRRMFGREGPICGDTILEWERLCANNSTDPNSATSAIPKNACIIAISKIDGPIKLSEDPT
jgi:hypothetical protein